MVCRPVRSKEEAMKPGSGAPPAMTVRGSNHLDGCRPGTGKCICGCTGRLNRLWLESYWRECVRERATEERVC